jgi:protein-L-isoaspartate(D-aspartate) O-methyltransferase
MPERENMVKTQLLPRGICEPRLLCAMRKVPRERFVPGPMKPHAYDDRALAIGNSQTISQPYIVALMSQALELTGNKRVLEIGTGSGYQAAILAEMSKSVYSVERIASLQNEAKRILDELGYTNIFLKVFNGTLGWPEHSPYNAIIVTAGTPVVPQPLLDQLDEKGRLVVPVGNRVSQELMKISKKDGNFLPAAIT